MAERCGLGFLEFLVKFSQVWLTFPSAQQKVPGLRRAELRGHTTGQVSAWLPCSDPGVTMGTQGMGTRVPHRAGTGATAWGTPSAE